MDEFKLLTAGVQFGKGRKSKTIRFAEREGNENDGETQCDHHSLNFFGESRGQGSKSNKRKEPDSKSKGREKFKRQDCSSISHADPSDDGIEPEEEINIPDDKERDAWFNSEDEVRAFRKRNRIYVYTHSVTGKNNNRSGGASTVSRDVPKPFKSFSQLESHYNVSPWIVENVLHNFKIRIPTCIQMQAIPCILTGHSLLASAPTGSGKTLAFLLPLIALMKAPAKEFLRSLVILPTRELATQTVREFDALRGHKNFRCKILERQTTEQTNGVKRRLDLGVSTPLKLIQLLHDQQVSLQYCRHIVLDEADRLLDMGFAGQIDEIIAHADLDKTQLLLFSATLPENVLALAETIIPEAIRIAVGAPMSGASDIDQQLMFVTNEQGKLTIFKQLVIEGRIIPPALVFVQSIERAKELFKELVFEGVFVDIIHAERTKSERERIIQGFREKKIWILICTDLMARGVDFKGVRVVVNWDLPQTASSYVHRIGRTGRAGRSGEAITFFSLEDVKYLPVIVGVMRQSGCNVPEWMMQLKKPSKKEKKQFQKRPIERRRITTAHTRLASSLLPSSAAGQQLVQDKQRKKKKWEIKRKTISKKREQRPADVK